MRILSLDLATKTGWAHSSGQSGSADFTPKRGDTPGIRWIRFSAWLGKLLDEIPFDLIVYEKAGRHQSRAAAHICHGYITRVEEFAEIKKIELTSFEAGTIKTHALGTGRKKKGRTKGHMIMEAENEWPDLIFKDDNHADAVWLLSLAMKEFNLGPFVPLDPL